MFLFNKLFTSCFILTFLSIKAPSVQDNEAMLDLEPLLYDYIQQHNFDPDVYDQHTFLMIKDNLTQLIKEKRNNYDGLPASSLKMDMLSQIDFYLPNPIVDGVSKDCKLDVMNIYLVLLMLIVGNSKTPKIHDTRVLYPNDMWPYLLYDSWGKHHDGTMFGYFRYWGFIDECFSVVAEKTYSIPLNVNFTGEYCKIASEGIPNTTDLMLTLDDYSVLYDEHFIINNEKRLNLYKPQNFGPVQSIESDFINPFEFDYATCIPSSCSSKDLTVSLNHALRPYNRHVMYTDCQVKDQHIEMDGSEIAGVTVFSILGFILLLATCAEIYCIYNPDTSFNKGAGRFLLAFSIWTNSKKIFSYDGSSKQVTCVHGIRVLSLCWVIWGHQYTQIMDVAVNMMMLDDMARPLLMQTIMNATVSVDTFFMLSGLFITYGLLNQLKKTGRFNPLVFYIHRILRLMPGLALTVAFTATISTLIISGPDLYAYKYYIEHGCRRTWYLDVFFVSNLVEEDRMNYIDTDGTLIRATCIGQSWYTSADTQMFAVMPFVVLPIFFWKKIGLALLSFYTLMSVLIRMILIWAYDMDGTGTWADDQNPSNFRILYGPPWTRMGTYLVGAWAGYILYTYQDKKVKLPKVYVIIGWAISCTCLGLVLYGVYPYNHYPPDAMPLVTTIFYEGCFRVVWAAAVAWIVIACHWGYGGFVNWFLSLPALQPLSRLSYTMFLMAMPVQVLWRNSIRFPVYFSHYNAFEQTVGIIVATLACAWCLSLMAEGPIIRIEKILLGPRDRTTNADDKKESNHIEVELLKEAKEEENRQINKGYQETENYQHQTTKNKVF